MDLKLHLMDDRGVIASADATSLEAAFHGLLNRTLSAMDEYPYDDSDKNWAKYIVRKVRRLPVTKDTILSFNVLSFSVVWHEVH